MLEKFINEQRFDKVASQGIKLSFIVTLIFWIITLVFLAVYSPKSEKTYKTVKITLAPTPVERVEKKVANVPSASEAASKPAPAPQKAAAPAKKATQTANAQVKPKSTTKNTTPKPAAKTATTEPAKGTGAKPQQKKQITYKKSVEELMAEQAASSSKNKSWDDSMFDDEDSSSVSTSSSSSSNVGQISGSSALSGTAASSAGSHQSVSSVSSTANSSVGVSSSATKSALGKIATTSYVDTPTAGISSQSTIKSSTASDGKVAVALSDGSARILLEPAKPVIIISAANAKLIDSTRSVEISFRILPEGNVPLNGIKITPSALLPLEIQAEIKKQISTWRFASASDDGQAVFEYSIIKR